MMEVLRLRFLFRSGFTALCGCDINQGSTNVIKRTHKKVQGQQ